WTFRFLPVHIRRSFLPYRSLLWLFSKCALLPSFLLRCRSFILYIPMLNNDAAFISSAHSRSDRLQAFLLQPLSKLVQCLAIHLLQLVQKNETAFRIELPDDSCGYFQTIRTRYVIPLLTLIDELSIPYR